MINHDFAFVVSIAVSLSVILLQKHRNHNRIQKEKGKLLITYASSSCTFRYSGCFSTLRMDYRAEKDI